MAMWSSTCSAWPRTRSPSRRPSSWGFPRSGSARATAEARARTWDFAFPSRQTSCCASWIETMPSRAASSAIHNARTSTARGKSAPGREAGRSRTDVLSCRQLSGRMGCMDADPAKRPSSEQQQRRRGHVVTPRRVAVAVALALLVVSFRRHLRFARDVLRHRRRLRLAFTVLVLLRQLRNR